MHGDTNKMFLHVNAMLGNQTTLDHERFFHGLRSCVTFSFLTIDPQTKHFTTKSLSGNSGHRRPRAQSSDFGQQADDERRKKIPAWPRGNIYLGF
jgi:hypothetical protein